MNVLFDLDGTLTDPKKGIVRSIQYALDKLDTVPPAECDLVSCIGPPLRDSFQTLLNTSDPVLIEQAVEHYRARYGDTGIYENKLYSGIRETLETLTREKHQLFVATSKPTHYAEIIISHFDLAHYFNKVYGSEMDGRNSDKTGILSNLLSVEQLVIKDTCMIGDRKFDMQGARANAIDAIGVLWGYGSPEELNSAGAHHLCHNPADILKVLA